MGKIKNWMKLKAGRNVEMVWKHENTGEQVSVTKLGNGNYKLNTPKYQPQFFGNKEEARSEAVDYMRENTKGSESSYSERSTSGMSKKDRMRANRGR